METIGGKYLIPKNNGTVSWSWTYDKRKPNTKKFNNVPYFLESSIRILSVTALAESMKDAEVTWVLKTKNVFTWNFGSSKKTIAHSDNFLPYLDIQDVLNKIYGFCKRVI